MALEGEIQKEENQRALALVLEQIFVLNWDADLPQ